MENKLLNRLYKAILFRHDKVHGVYINLSKLLSKYGMAPYAKSAIRRILDNDTDKTILCEHTVINTRNQDIWLDPFAFCHYKDIILGYISSEDYDRIAEWIRLEESLQHSFNCVVTFFRNVKYIELIRMVLLCNKIKKRMPQEAKMIRKCAIMELMGRSLFMALYKKLAGFIHSLNRCVLKPLTTAFKPHFSM